MAETTNIEWADSTFNPVIGCKSISPGCAHCYAKTLVERFGGDFDTPRRTSIANWRQPHAWNARADAFEREHGRRRRVFCASLADVFDNRWDPQWRADLFELIAETPRLDWLLLTKRIGNVRGMVPPAWLEQDGWPAHVRLMISVVNQEEADRDIPKLLALHCPNGLSVEPLLGPVELGLQCENWSDDIVMDPETGAYECCKACDYTGIGNEIDWIIVGGESGPAARPMHPDWVRSLRDQCAAAGVPFLFKQHGEWLELDAGKPMRLVTDDSPNREQELARTEGFISAEGHFVTDPDEMTLGVRYRGLVRPGKKAAGRLLDDIEHNGFPEVRQ